MQYVMEVENSYWKKENISDIDIEQVLVGSSSDSSDYTEVRLPIQNQPPPSICLSIYRSYLIPSIGLPQTKVSLLHSPARTQSQLFARNQL